MPRVAAWLHHSQAAQRIVEHLHGDATPDVRRRALAQENVVVQINHLRSTCPWPQGSRPAS